MRRQLPRIVLLILLVAAIGWAALHRGQFDPQALGARIAGLGAWAPVAFVALYVIGTVIFLPGSLFSLAGGALFGPVQGAIYNLVGATIGATAAFLLARTLAGDWVARKAAGRLQRLIAGVEDEGWRFVAFVRLVPLFPFNMTNYVLGLTRIGLVPYIVASFICMAPGAVAYTWLGHAGREALSGDASAIRYGLLALGLLAAIAFLPRLISRVWAAAAGWIEPHELRRQMPDAAAPIVLDVRGTDEFDGALGHICGAMNIPLADLAKRLDALRAEGRDLAIVCRTDRRSAAAQAALRAAGFANVRVLRGGMERWNALGFEVIRSDTPTTPSPLQELPE
jgi:uncharacterized membrane protein YdjX (TVP38/TMEM64 family)/rhodanese-related sulfurtransferase